MESQNPDSQINSATEQALSLQPYVEIKQEVQDIKDHDEDIKAHDENIKDHDDYDTIQKCDDEIPVNPLELNENAGWNIEDYGESKVTAKSAICQICNKAFKDNWRLKRHCNQKHVKNGEMTEVNGVFVPNPNVEPREYVEKPKVDFPRKCKICNKGFSDKWRLGRHHEQVHAKTWKRDPIERADTSESKTKKEPAGNELFEQEMKTDTPEIQHVKVEDYYNIDQAELELSEEFVAGILRLIEELRLHIYNGDPNLERTMVVNEKLNDAVSCYINKYNLLEETTEQGRES